MSGTFRRGVLVEVRCAAEILATLDAEGALDALPFMPEMLQYCGHRFVVDKRVEKVCDTIKTYGSRRMRDILFLEDRRCDGSGHDGCQAECRLFWKESWLRRVSPCNSQSLPNTEGDASQTLIELASRYIKETREINGKTAQIYRCQATELYRASTHLRVWDPRQYIREFTSGNVTFGHFLRISARAFVMEPLRKLKLIPTIPLSGSRTDPGPDESLDLHPGEWIRVKTKEEIADTLTSDGRDRGLWFDREMLPFCGKTYQVRQRVKRFIDDRSGRMIEFKKECVTLSGVVCSGERSLHRYFCPRATYAFWREKWLRRITVELN